MKHIKYCPDIKSYEVEKTFTIDGDFGGYHSRPILHECIKEKCVAYKVNFKVCEKYQNGTEYEEQGYDSKRDV